MDPDDAMTKANSAVNGMLDILKKRWFIALLLWAILATQVASLWSGRSSTETLSAALVDSLGIEILGPFIDGLAAVLKTAGENSLVYGCAGLIVTVLTFAAMWAFWRDGRDLHLSVVVDLAPVSIMLRFVVLSTFASIAGSLVSLLVLLVIAATLYAVAAAIDVPRHQRAAASAAAVVTIAMSFAIALATPVVLTTVALWNALM